MFERQDADRHNGRRQIEYGASLPSYRFAVVREFLIGYCAGETDYQHRNRLERETIASIGTFRAADRLSRDALHEPESVR